MPDNPLAGRWRRTDPPQAPRDPETVPFGHDPALLPDVGKWVALGGGATHLPEAEERLRTAMGDGAGDGAGPAALRGYAGLLP